MSDDRWVAEACPTCGVGFMLSKDFVESVRWTGRAYCCPNQHGIQYKETDRSKLEEKVASAERSRDHYKELNEAKYAEEQRLGRVIASLRGVITRMKKSR